MKEIKNDLAELEGLQGLDEQCAMMAGILGLEEPVSERILLAAIADRDYAHNLLVCREEPAFLQHLLENPPLIPEPSYKGRSAGTEIKTATLISKAAESLIGWAKTGFSSVSDETYNRRLAACAKCPDLITPPAGQGFLYKMAGADKNEKTVCRRCGCVAKVKAGRPNDTCPVQDVLNPGFNRWNEPHEKSAYNK